MNTDLLTRLWSCHKPRVAGYEPAISGTVERVSRSKRNAWRCVATVDGSAMATSHHNTKAAAESHLAGMMDAYTKVHYEST